MYQTLYAEMRRNRAEREEAYDELHHQTRELRRIELAKIQGFGGVKVTPRLAYALSPRPYNERKQ
jgi:hypothetical protein